MAGGAAEGLVRSSTPHPESGPNAAAMAGGAVGVGATIGAAAAGKIVCKPGEDASPSSGAINPCSGEKRRAPAALER
jgi:hypothetical protein